MPEVVVASGNSFNTRSATLDGEQDSVGTIDIGATGSVGVTTPLIAVAGSNTCGGAMVDGKV